MISSISNRELTLLRKLSQKKHRQKEQLFIVEGERAVEQVIGNGRLKIEEMVFDEGARLWESGKWGKYSGTFRSVQVDQGIFDTISDTENPQGVMALCEIPDEAGLEDLAGSEGVIIAIDGIQDPGNLGTIIRTAVWFGVKGVLVGKGTVDLFHPKVVRSTAGATGSLPYRHAILSEELGRLEDRGWEIAILDSGPESVSLSGKKPAERQVIVVGNEANGVSRQLFKEGRPLLEIRQGGDAGGLAESLNASIALSIALYALVPNHK